MIRVTGAREMGEALEALGERGAKLRDEALTAAAEPVVTEARGRAPSPTIADGIQLIQIVDRDGGRVAEIGLPGGRRDWFYGLFYELGTGPRAHKSGKRTGSMPARPYLRPAFDAQMAAAQRRYFEVVRRGLEGASRG